jgi:two-component system, NtrC family, sensor kinase
MINVELKRLVHLLNDIKTQSCDTEEIATDFDVVLLVCDLITLIRCQIAKTIRLEVDAEQPFMVHLPENTLQQAILNLVINACEALAQHKFGQICIRIFKSKTHLTIQVIDNGAGFSPAMLTSRIAPCHLAENPTGLMITQRFIKNMGGTLTLSNHFPHGACVSLLLPEQCLLENDLA